MVGVAHLQTNEVSKMNVQLELADVISGTAKKIKNKNLKKWPVSTLN